MLVDYTKIILYVYIYYVLYLIFTPLKYIIYNVYIN